jgi:hypothetical protein
MTAEHIGSIEFTNEEGNNVTLTRVLYAPKASSKLISTGRLFEQGLTMEYKGKRCTLKPQMVN